MQDHNFLESLNTRRNQKEAQLSATIEDLLKQVEDLKQQLKESLDAKQKESFAEGLAQEAAKAVVRATKLLNSTEYGEEGVELLRKHLNKIMDNPEGFDGDWEPAGEVDAEIPELPEPVIEEVEEEEAAIEVEASEVEEQEEVASTNGHELDFSGFKNIKQLKTFAINYIDVRRKTRRQIEEDLRVALKEQGITQSEIERAVRRKQLAAGPSSS